MLAKHSCWTRAGSGDVSCRLGLSSRLPKYLLHLSDKTHLYIGATLPEGHSIFSTALFGDATIYQHLMGNVRCGKFRDGDLRATGVPPHISILAQMESYANSIALVVPSMERIAEKIVSEVTGNVVSVLEDRAIGCNTVTTQGLQTALDTKVAETIQNTLSKMLDESGVFEIVKSVRERESKSSSSSASSKPGTMHMWGGKMHCVPEHFSFPNGGALVAWQEYCCGNSGKGYPPLRVLQNSDMSSPNLKRRLADYHFLMRTVEDEVKSNGNWILNPSLSEANEMFQAGCRAIELPASTSHNRKRRGNQLKWTTYVNEVRFLKKQRRE